MVFIKQSIKKFIILIIVLATLFSIFFLYKTNHREDTNNYNRDSDNYQVMESLTINRMICVDDDKGWKRRIADKKL